MLNNKVVVQFKDRTIRKGTTRDFNQNKPQLHLEENNGEVAEIKIEELKALFFVKDYEGDKNRQDNYEDDITGGGRKVKIKFSDGETIVGYTLGYSPNRQGFFLTPADLQGNNERVFVVRSATENIEFL
jgi:hypothetical protein